MLVFDSPAEFREQPAAMRYLHIIVLMAVRDGADQLEVRFTDDGGILYYRVAGRDWELTPVPEDVFPELKSTLRNVARLVAPERPDVTVLGEIGDARYEQLEVGWLSYQIGSHILDAVVRIDPREPWGGITIEFESAAEVTGLAGETLLNCVGEVVQED